MTAQLAAFGRLVAEPASRITKNDNQMAMARLAVSLPCHSAEEGQATFWLSVVAFLMRHNVRLITVTQDVKDIKMLTRNYRKIAQSAVTAERAKDYRKAAVLWAEARLLAKSQENRNWCDSRAEWCRNFPCSPFSAV